MNRGSLSRVQGAFGGKFVLDVVEEEDCPRLDYFAIAAAHPEPAEYIACILPVRSIVTSANSG